MLSKTVYKKSFVLVCLLSCVVVCVFCCGCRDNVKIGNDNIVSKTELEPLLDESKNDIYLVSPDIDLAKSKLIISDQDYYKLVNAYMATFNHWLSKDYRLELYQYALVGQGCQFKSEGINQVFKRYGGFGRDNVYLRNAAYVERLSADDLRTLLSNIDENKFYITESELNIVKNTWKDVFKVFINDNKESFKLIYSKGALSGVQSASNDALVLYIGYDLVLKDAKLQSEIVEMLSDLMKSELSKSLNTDVAVIVEWG